MKMAYLIPLFITTLLLSAAPACEKTPKTVEEAKTLSVTPQDIFVSYEAGKQTLSVTANCDWGIASEDKTWCNVSPSGGMAGTSTVQVTLAENPTEEKRETRLVLSYGPERTAVTVSQNYKVEAVRIADPNFLKALLRDYDADKDGILSSVEARQVTSLNVSGCEIQEMGELGSLFKDLTALHCANNKLTELDISALTKLKSLDCTGNPSLKSIYVWSGFVENADFKKPASAEYVQPSIPTPAGYSLVWADEFAGDRVDPNKWAFEDWAPGRVNNELQRYVPGGVLDGERTAYVEGGVLHIKAMKHKGQVISARMNSTGSWTYGYMEARIQLPKGKGTWPAFWMMPRDFSRGWPACGEIDIMEEVGVNPNYTSSSIHTQSYNHVKKTQKTKEIFTKGAEDEFHVYAVEWTADYLQFYTDGKPQLRFNNDGKGNNDTWPFNKSFYIILNLAWGGDWGGWNGVNEAALPCILQVDYVRVFQKQ